MNRSLVIAAALCCVLIVGPSFGGPGWSNEAREEGNDNLVVAAPLLIDSINGDPEVSLVLHVGDIHSGSMPCTGAGVSPLPAASNPIWNYGVFGLFAQFKAPLVYTPGDNEWTDCHKKKQLSGGARLNELAAVRQLFFPEVGVTLGAQKKRVFSQAEVHDQANPADGQFVKNVMWKRAQVVFVTLNVPGSNNDGLPWTAPFTDEAARLQEVAERNAANLRWLRRAFAWASNEHAKGVVVGLQADMWDPAAIAPGGDGLDGYTEFVRVLADLALHFRRPVLLINGDSHLAEADQPLADPSSATGTIHGAPPVPNLTRITVQGSTNKPREWLRLTVDPHSRGVFTWRNVIYCDDTTCPK